jgi:hypothetical protein
MNFREIEWEAVDCIYLVQDRDQWRPVVNTVMNETSGSIKGGEFLELLIES